MRRSSAQRVSNAKNLIEQCWHFAHVCKSLAVVVLLSCDFTCRCLLLSDYDDVCLIAQVFRCWVCVYPTPYRTHNSSTLSVPGTPPWRRRRRTASTAWASTSPST